MGGDKLKGGWGGPGASGMRCGGGAGRDLGVVGVDEEGVGEQLRRGGALGGVHVQRGAVEVFEGGRPLLRLLRAAACGSRRGDSEAERGRAGARHLEGRGRGTLRGGGPLEDMRKRARMMGSSK
jgi:hypothetical protein